MKEKKRYISKMQLGKYLVYGRGILLSVLILSAASAYAAQTQISADAAEVSEESKVSEEAETSAETESPEENESTEAAKKTEETMTAEYCVHSWNAGKVTRQPTVAAKGVKTYTCTECRSTREAHIAQLPYKKTVSKARYAIMTVNGLNAAVYLGTSAKKASSVTIPSTIKVNGIQIKVTAIAPKALYNQKSLKKVTIGANVSGIGRQAFRGCSQLSRITIKSTVLKSIGTKALTGISNSAVIKVPAKNKKAYKRLLKKSTGYRKTMKIK